MILSHSVELRRNVVRSKLRSKLYVFSYRFVQSTMSAFLKFTMKISKCYLLCYLVQLDSIWIANLDWDWIILLQANLLDWTFEDSSLEVQDYNVPSSSLFTTFGMEFSEHSISKTMLQGVMSTFLPRLVIVIFRGTYWKLLYFLKA